MKSIVNSSGFDREIAAAFLGAFLLTADEVVAERAVEKCLTRLDSAEMTAENLMPAILRIARQLQSESELTSEMPAWAPQRLPSELQNVLRLRADARCCFVLRLLHGLRPDVCADILRLTVSQLESCTQEALCELAKMR
jgi:DNA-directed RNA polymerase specialized sigma24 family protein